MSSFVPSSSARPACNEGLVIDLSKGGKIVVGDTAHRVSQWLTRYGFPRGKIAPVDSLSILEDQLRKEVEKRTVSLVILDTGLPTTPADAQELSNAEDERGEIRRMIGQLEEPGRKLTEEEKRKLEAAYAARPRVLEIIQMKTGILQDTTGPLIEFLGRHQAFWPAFILHSRTNFSQKGFAPLIKALGAHPHVCISGEGTGVDLELGVIKKMCEGFRNDPQSVVLPQSSMPLPVRSSPLPPPSGRVGPTLVEDMLMCDSLRRDGLWP